MSDVKAELKIVRKIGNGMFGEVFLGDDPVHGEVAVKIFRRDHPDVETDNQWKARRAALLEEGRRLKSADHQTTSTSSAQVPCASRRLNNRFGRSVEVFRSGLTF
jgi:hypothetical protein